MNLKLYFMHLMMAHKRKKSRKKKPWIGKQFMVPRNGLPDVETFLYEPEVKKYSPMPVMFNIHGGAWVGGDATALDTQSQQIADTLSAFVVNINYKNLEVKPFPYPQQEGFDTVLYFARHAKEYRMDIKRFNLIGYSAGGHICAGAAMLLRDTGFELASQILCYPFLDFRIFDSGIIPGMENDSRNDKTMKLMSEFFFRNGMDKMQPIMSPAAAPTEKLKGLAPVEIIICGPDALYQQGVDYHQKLNEAGVPCKLKKYEESTHGFMEGNYPEVEWEKNPKQEAIRDECFLYLKERMKIRWGYEEE